MTIATLNTEGFLITEIAGEWTMLRADFGNGYRAAAIVGAPAGTRTWAIKIDVLPDTPAPPWSMIGTDTRAAYLWQFFRASKAANDAPFWLEIEDPESGTRKNYLASFVDHRLSYQVLCCKVYATGLNLRERRQLGTVSPIPIGLGPATRSGHGNL